MKVALQSFTAPLGLKPLDVATTKDKVIVLLTVVALGVLATCIYSAVSDRRKRIIAQFKPLSDEQRRTLTQEIIRSVPLLQEKGAQEQAKSDAYGMEHTKPSFVTSPSPKQVSEDAQVDKGDIPPSSISPKVENREEIIAPGVKKTLEGLFKGSEYSLDNLPVYSMDCTAIDLNKMSAPVMIGKTKDGCALILIKVQSTFTQEEIDAYYRMYFDIVISVVYQVKDKLEYVLILLNTGADPLKWKQMHKPIGCPSFFVGEFTGEDGSLVTEQTRGFNLVHTLLSNGSGRDLRGLTWKILK